MPNKLSHFAIEADDVARAKAFYEAVFGWNLQPWGPPNFFRFQDAGIHGALQERREPAPAGRKGMELTFAVDDLEATAARIQEAGGKITGDPMEIPQVGRLVGFEDTEGNAALIMQYAPGIAADMGL